MTCLYLTEAEVDQLLEMPAAIEAMRQAFLALAEGRADNVPRRRARAPGIVLHSMSAAAEYLGLVGWKQYTTTRSGAQFLVGLHEQASGELRALIAADRLGQVRTGAVTGLAVRFLAAEDTDRMGLFGSGWQAQSQLEAVVAARPIRRAVVYSRRPEPLREFTERMAERLGIDVVPADRPRQAVEGMPVVVTATTSHEPVFEGDWLEDGAVVCAVGSNWLQKAEIDTATVRRAKRVVCDSVACCQLEAGDFTPSLEAGEFDWSQAVELQQVVAGEIPATSGIQLFKSVGMALEDVALGHLLLERARERHVGRMLEMGP